MLSFELVLVFLLLGAFVGIVAGLFGVGGGGIMVPILTTIFLSQGLSEDKVLHMALGTSMASIIFTSLSSMRAHNAKNAVDWAIVKGISVGIVVGVFSATYLATAISSIHLAIFFSAFMAYVSLQMFLNKKPKPSSNITGRVEMAGAGLGIGAISALVSIGGGTLTVPYLIWRNIDIKKAIGTSAAIGFPISVVGTLGYLANGWPNTDLEYYTVGFVYIPAVLLISVTSFFTAPYGAQLANSLPVGTLKKIFSVLVMFLSVKMLLSII